MNFVQELNDALHNLKNETDDKKKWSHIIKLTNMAKSPLIDDDIRFKALYEVYAYDPEMGVETLISIRDFLDLSDKDMQESHIDVLRRVINYPLFPSSQRYLCALSCWNSDLIQCCYEFFNSLMNDESMLIMDRVECSKFLYYTQNPEYLENALIFLKKIVSDVSLDSKFRYETICCFIGDTGIAAKYNTNRLAVYGDDEFVYPLQHLFFFRSQNNIRYRLLSGQYLLQISKNQDEVQRELLHIAQNYDDEDSHNVRADAADILLRMATTSEIRESCGKIIAQLGNEDNKNALQQNIYSNKQNIHLISNVEQYIEKLVVDTSLGKTPDFDTVYSQVTNLINNIDITYAQRIHAFKSLNRVSIDSAKFTKFKLTQARIFCYVWQKIITHPKCDVLKIRLIEELIDMSDTCSTGHCSRFVNVFSHYEDESIMITLESQLKANIDARFNTLIKNINEVEKRENIICGMTPDDECRNEYIDFITEHSQEVKNELYKEFVSDGYMSKQKFERLFQEEISRITK